MKPLILLFLLGFIQNSYAIDHPKERIDYWRDNFRELTADQDDRVVRAKYVFQRIREAAGVGRNASPRLHIIAEDPYNISLPIAIRDGWVILSKRVLDICYQQAKHGDDKLAFVLGHEISHLLHDSFMHVELFTALDTMKYPANVSDKTSNKVKNQVIDNLQELISKPEHFAYKEFEADEKGIIFSAMAGFDTSVIVSDDNNDSFFQQWQRAQDIARFFKSNEQAVKTHPITELRETKLRSQLKTIENRAQLYTLGLMYYQSGNFKQAIDNFDRFLQYFSSREVYHNLATSYHQLAIIQFMEGSNTPTELPFKFSLVADPDSRAIGLTSKRLAIKNGAFSETIKHAIEYYEKAIELDGSYHLSYSNLGAAYLLNNEPYKAIALLRDAQNKWPDNVSILNVLGVAFYTIDKLKDAEKALFKSAYNSEGTDAALYNLGKIAFLSDKKQQAERFWLSYLQQDDSSYWARLIRDKYGVGEHSIVKRGLPKLEFESIGGMQVADYKSDIPNDWQADSLHNIGSNEQAIVQYNRGIKTVLAGDAIRLIQASSEYSGKSMRGVAIGDGKAPVVRAYGKPAIQIETTQGRSWVYPSKGISFQFEHDKVVSWLVY